MTCFLCSLWMSPAERLAVPSCVCLSRASWTCSVGQRLYLGRLAAGVPAGAKLCSRRGCPTPFPFPTGHGPIHRLLRSQPARRLNQNQLFSSLSYCLLSPAAIVEGCLFLAICSWISLLRWASQGLPGQPHSQYCFPSTFSGPSIGPSRGFSSGFSQMWKVSSAPHPPSLRAELCRPARGIREGPAQCPPFPLRRV